MQGSSNEPGAGLASGGGIMMDKLSVLLPGDGFFRRQFERMCYFEGADIKECGNLLKSAQRMTSFHVQNMRSFGDKLLLICLRILDMFTLNNVIRLNASCRVIH